VKIGFGESRIKTSVGADGLMRTMESRLTYYTEVVKPQVIAVPIGFETDLGSIPLALQNVFPKDGKAMYGYILHDYLYKMGMYSRSTSDDMLEEAMQSLGVSWWRRKSVRLGLKLGGWVAWNKHRKGLKCTK
jgi:hypothetical protein